MADIHTVRDKCAAALDEADMAIGNKTVTQTLADLQTSVANLQASNQDLANRIAAAKAALG